MRDIRISLRFHLSQAGQALEADNKGDEPASFSSFRGPGAHFVFDIADISQTWRLAAECHERDLFIMFHTAEQAGHQYPGKGRCGAEKAAKFCLNHPEVRVIFAHFGGGLWAFEAMPEMRLALSNAYYDTAAWPWLYGPKIIDALFAIGAGEKVFFGSDWPILEFPRYQEILSHSALDIKQREALLYKTASSLLLRR